MLTTGIVVACIELALLGIGEAMRRRSPFAGGAAILYRISAMIALASLACILAALLLDAPQVRGVAAVGALAGLGVWAVRAMRRGPRIGPLHAETQAPATEEAAYTVRTVPRTGSGAYVPAQAPGGQRGPRAQAVLRNGGRP